MRRVVVTGLGFVSPIGDDKETMVENLRNGYCGISEIESFKDENIKVKFAGECKNFDPLKYFSKKEAKRMDRVNQFGVVAARKAVEDSQIDLKKYEPSRVSIIMATGVGGINTIEVETTKANQKNDFSRINPFFIPMMIPNMTSAQIAIDLGIHGYVSCPVTACAAANNAILDAYRSIKDGYSDVVLAGGADASISKLAIGGFYSMKALNTSESLDRASIPFDKERSGFVMGEGCGVLILEDLEKAKKRGAKIYAEIVGAAMTCDANHITAPDPEGEFAAIAMKKAIEENGNSIEDVDYINAHGTSTPLNDKIETLAIKKVFKDRAKDVSISSTKSMTGHLLGASGAIEAIITILSMNNSFIPPTINYRVKDEKCDLDISPNESKDKEINLAISNSLGFGGHNVTIAFKKIGEDNV